MTIQIIIINSKSVNNNILNQLIIKIIPHIILNIFFNNNKLHHNKINNLNTFNKNGKINFIIETNNLIIKIKI